MAENRDPYRIKRHRVLSCSDSNHRGNLWTKPWLAGLQTGQRLPEVALTMRRRPGVAPAGDAPYGLFRLAAPRTDISAELAAANSSL